MAYPTFFMGDVPELPEEYENLEPAELWHVAYEAGAQKTATHLYEYWQQRLVETRGQISRVYNDVVKVRLDWLYRIFVGIEPNPTGDLAE